MTNRIKIGDTYFELPQGALDRPTQVVAEKTNTPAALDPVAFSANTPDQVAQYIARPAERVEKVDKIPEAALDPLAALQAFAGPKSTYPQQWQNYAEGKQKLCGFNTWAFLFGLQWFVFHKMYGKALLAAVLEVSLAIAALHSARGTAGLGLMLIIGISLPRLAIGFWANLALLQKARREIDRINGFSVDNARKLQMLAAAGSGSFVALMLLYGALFVLKFTLA